MNTCSFLLPYCEWSSSVTEEADIGCRRAIRSQQNKLGYISGPVGNLRKYDWLRSWLRRIGNRKRCKEKIAACIDKRAKCQRRERCGRGNIENTGEPCGYGSNKLPRKPSHVAIGVESRINAADEGRTVALKRSQREIQARVSRVDDREPRIVRSRPVNVDTGMR